MGDLERAFRVDRLEPLGLGSLRWPNFSEEDLKGAVQGQDPGIVPGEGHPAPVWTGEI